jgi:beta-glucoside operon transcriptional antiterminator
MIVLYYLGFFIWKGGSRWVRIKQIFNNNVVLTMNEYEEEVVVMGRGIGFQKKKGEAIDEDLIDKTFILTENVAKSIFPDIYQQLSEDEIDIVVDIINMAEKELDVEFQSNLYIALADHIHYTLERARELLPLTNPLNYEVRKYYPKEYEVGKKALEMIEERLNVELYKDEASSIAIHFVTGQKEGYFVQQTIKVTEIVHNIINIVRIHFGTTFDEESISYARFLTHIQYFAHRVVFNEYQDEADSFLYEQVQKSYPKSFECVERIKKYVQNSYDFEMGDDEQVYLTIHIQRLLQEKNKKNTK